MFGLRERPNGIMYVDRDVVQNVPIHPRDAFPRFFRETDFLQTEISRYRLLPSFPYWCFVMFSGFQSKMVSEFAVNMGCPFMEANLLRIVVFGIYFN